MKPVLQRIKHAPDEGSYGDCHRAAIASVLELPYEDVPHFVHDFCSSEEFRRREVEFLAKHGLFPVLVPFSFEDAIEAVLGTLARLNSDDVVFLLGGRSRTGVNHTVVCHGGKIAHDPSPTKAGIIGPCDDGFYWVTFFVSAAICRGEHTTEKAA